jgi:hypothetical protein
LSYNEGNVDEGKVNPNECIMYKGGEREEAVSFLNTYHALVDECNKGLGRCHPPRFAIENNKSSFRLHSNKTLL